MKPDSGKIPTSKPHAGNPGVSAAAYRRSKTGRRDDNARTPAGTDVPKPVAAVRAANQAGLGLARRLIAVACVVALVLITSYSSLRLYFSQKQQIADLQAQKVDKQQEIDDLNDELQRWQDPNYVKAQARTRLGWVMPGEISFQVVDQNGALLNGVTLDRKTSTPTTPVEDKEWYEDLWDSVLVADDPMPAQPDEPDDGANG